MVEAMETLEDLAFLLLLAGEKQRIGSGRNATREAIEALQSSSFAFFLLTSSLETARGVEGDGDGHGVGSALRFASLLYSRESERERGKGGDLMSHKHAVVNSIE